MPGDDCVGWVPGPEQALHVSVTRPGVPRLEVSPWSKARAFVGRWPPRM